MHWLDIVFLIIMVVFGLWGLWKGFLSALLQMFTVALTIVLVILLAQPFTLFIDGIFGGGISGFFSSQMGGIVEGWGVASDFVVPSDMKASAVISDYLPKLDGILKTIVSALVGGDTISAGTNIVRYFSNILGGYTTIIVGAIVLFILFRIALGLLGRLFNRITENRGINGLDRFLGLIFGVVKGLFYVSIIIVALKILSIIGPINTLVTGWFDKTDVLSTFANWLYGIMDSLLAKIDFNSMFRDIFS